MIDLSRLSVVCLSTMNWDFLWTRKQRFMSLMAKRGTRVLYVEPVLHPLSRWMHPESAGDRRLSGRLRSVGGNIWVYSPPALLPTKVFPFQFNRINQAIVARSVRRICALLELREPWLWFYDIKAEALIDKIAHSLVIYDCFDDMRAPGYLGSDIAFYGLLEDTLVSRADVVFTSANNLLARIGSRNPTSFWIPNGVDVSLFSRAQLEVFDVPEELKGLSHPILGFVGGIYNYIDLKLIEEIAYSRPRWNIVLIGPVHRSLDIAALQRLHNVFFLGRKPVGTLPTFLQHFDVCLNPFKAGPLAESVNPLKVYEYLAAGKPVVSVNMPEIRPLGDLIYRASGSEDFVAKIESALTEDSPERQRARLQYVADYDWQTLLDRMLRIVGEIQKR